jgi:hypothetical protein
MTLIIDLHYFANTSLFSTLINNKYINFESYESYQKGGFRNRCEVIGRNGIVQLIVPLAGGRTQKRIITEVKIDYREDWQRSHFRTLLSCYNRSPFFEYYRDDLERIFQTRCSWLVDWNLVCFEWLLSVLKLEISIDKTTSFQATYSSPDFKDYRGFLDPKHRFLPGINPVEYDQVFVDQLGFVPGLSILDLLFCEGPETSNILKKMNSDSI